MSTTVIIPVPDSAGDETRCPKISDFEVSASYNWLDKYTPTVLAPAIPPIWSQPAIVPSLEPDSGPCYVDQNADRNPVSPLAALIRAVQTSHPDLDFTSIDIITDRRTIRKLYGFVAGDRSYFQFGVAILGKTALLTRMEDRNRDERPRNERPSSRNNSYREAFEAAYLKIPISAKGSTSHHRVVQYTFGGMTYLVRSAIDGYLRDRVKEFEPINGDKQASPEELTDFVKAMTLDEPATSFQFTLPQAATFELSTRSKFANMTEFYAKKMPDLWISQMANFIEAFHTYNQRINFGPKASQEKWRGTAQRSTISSQPRSTKFTNIKIKPLKDKLMAWETANAETLGKLMVVIKKVIEATEQLQGTCIVSYDGKERVLKLSRAKEGEVPGLPEELQSCFMQPIQEG